MTNLVAYIPVLNRQYLEWLKKHQPFKLHLISKDTAELLIPRLQRNLGALHESEVTLMISCMFKGEVGLLNLSDLPIENDFIAPDEDISHLIAERFLFPAGCQILFEQIWARWDMSAVKRQEPVIPDLEISLDLIHMTMLNIAFEIAKGSPDWWRQIGAVAFNDEGAINDKVIERRCNNHFPTEYEASIFGDPRINFDAGDPSGADVYLSLHAEKMLIASCARYGISLEGASLAVTTFPCPDCARWIAAAGIKKLFFFEGYSVLKGFETLKAAGIRIVKVKVPEVA